MINYSKAIALNTDLLTAQSFITQEGNLTLGIIVTGTGEDIFTIVRQVILDLQQTFFDSDDPIPQRLAQAAKDIKQKVSLAQDLQILLTVWKEEEITTTDKKTSDTMLYILSEGQIQAILYRDQSVTYLTNQQENGQLISGHLQPDDRLLFMTPSLLTTIDEKKLQQLFTVDTDSLKEEVEEFAHDHPTNDPVALIQVSVKSEPLNNHSDDYEYPLIDLDSPQDNFRARHTPIDPSRRFNPKLPSVSSIAAFIPKLSFNKSLLRNRKVLGGLVSILLLLLITGSFYLYTNLRTSNSNQQTLQLLSQAQQSFDSAKALKDSDSQKASENLKSAQELLALVLAQNPDNSTAKDLQQQIENSKFEILKIHEVGELPVFLKLDLIKKGFTTQKLSLSLDRIVLLDQSQKTLVVLTLSTKNNQILAGTQQLGDAKFSAINGDFIFTYSPDKGITKIELPDTKATVAIPPDPEWGGMVDIYGFGSNIYLVDDVKQQIWKYIPISSGYSDKTAYFKQSVALLGTKRIHIDSSIWLLKDNTIEKYTSGNSDFFSLSNLDQPLSQITSFYLSDETENIYLLDKPSGRIVVVNKTGHYVSQYGGESLKQIEDLIVDEQDKRIYLLGNNTLYQLDLK